MPHKNYYGKTGVVWNITRRAVGVIINKQVGGRIKRKKIHVRLEHVRPSNCKADLKARVQAASSPRRPLAASLTSPSRRSTCPPVCKPDERCRVEGLWYRREARG